jgi:hypothetical protein
MFMIQGPVAVFLSPRTPNGFLLYAKSVHAKVTACSALSYPGLAVLGACIEAFDDAQVEAGNKSPIAVAERNAKALKVYQELGHLRDYVQAMVETMTSPADAVALIVSAGLSVRKARNYAKPAFAAKYGAVSGEALLVALAVPRAHAYYWEYSVDQSEWTAMPETTKASTTLAGLTAGQVYYFRFRTLTPNGKTDYSQVVSLRVH